MEKIIYVLIGIFAIIALFSIAYACIKIIKGIGRSKRFIKNGSDIESALEEINNRADSKTVANGFIRLLQCSYMLVHLLVNAGNQYNDKVQSEYFNNSLTDDVLVSLNSLEGKYV